MLRIRTAAAIVLCIALSPTARAQAPQTATPLIQGETPTIRVVTTGTGPKRTLRYRVTPQASSRIDMIMQMSMTMTMEGMDAQTVPVRTAKMALDVDVTSVAANGDIACRVVFTEAALDVPSIAAAPSSLKGLSAEMTMTDRGIVKSMILDTATITDPALQQVLAASGLEKLSAPLPEEPVGVGARWEVTQNRVTNGVRMVQKGLYEVVALDDSTASLTVTIEQTAPAQKLSPPGMPAGADVSLVGLTGTGTGRLTLTRGALILYGEIDIMSKMSMDIGAEGQTRRLSADTEMKMAMTPGKR